MKHHFKQADSLLNELLVNTTNLSGKRLETLETYIEVFNNLLNAALRSEAQLEDTQDQLAKIILAYGEQEAKMKELWYRYQLSEKIHEVGIDKVVEDFRERASKILMT